MKKIAFMLIPLLIVALAFSPVTSITIKGIVNDDQGNPVSFAAIKEKGTKNAVSADDKGKFTIIVSSENAVLIISAVGYDVREIKLNGQTTINVSLSTSHQQLNEVVVTAYGKSLRRSKQNPMDGRALFTPSWRPKPEEEKYDSKYGNQDSITDFNTEGYDRIIENPFVSTSNTPLSTFSIDVDAASYSNVRRFLNAKQLPPAGAVRIEEMINYFHYDYPQPTGDVPFTVNTEMDECPWNKDHKLVLIGLQGKKVPVDHLPASNLVFLIDVSGSMMDENKLPLVQESMKLLVDQLRQGDKVSIVVYAGAAGLVLRPTDGSEKDEIKDAIDALKAGGSTAGGAGIKLAYKTAKENFVKNGNNRVILCTDGDFNVGISSDDELERMIEEERKSGVFLTVLGYGMGNYQDSKMQKLADKGNGNHAYIDGLNEAKKVLVSEFGGTLFTIAKDVKLQIEFNPTKVQGYRLIGYENRMLNKEDFNDDKKDAGELGSGHTVTALYEVIPVGVKDTFIKKVDDLKYQQQNTGVTKASGNGEIMNIKLRYKKPDGDESKLIEHPVMDIKAGSIATTENFRFAAAVAEFGLLLRNSEFKSKASFANVLELANSADEFDEEGYRSEFIRLAGRAKNLVKKENSDVGKN